MKHYSSAFVFALIASVGGYLLGGLAGLWAVVILSILETSLSFDNAIVNASILQNWDAQWRRYFLVYGMPVAVFGMRLIFPLAVVGVALKLGPVSVLSMAINDPTAYSNALHSVHHEIAAFGGSFLLMLFLSFFIDKHKDEHWLSWVEKPLAAVGKLDAISVAICMATITISSVFLPQAQQHGFLFAGMGGVITYILAESVGSLMGGEDGDVGSKIIKQGVGGFLYLELIDASFSFDGVIGAFALSHNIFVIALGLGVGAMFVRSMTLHLVDTNTISKYKYLEHGAFWAIGALAAIMFVSTVAHVPEVVSGLVGAFFIGTALIASLIANKKEAA